MEGGVLGRPGPGRVFQAGGEQGEGGILGRPGQAATHMTVGSAVHGEREFHQILLPRERQVKAGRVRGGWDPGQAWVREGDPGRGRVGSWAGLGRLRHI